MAKRKKKEAFDWEDEDQEEIIWVSKSEIKRDAEDLKQLGEKLVNLTKANLTKVPLDDSLKDAIELAQRLQKEARRRQLQYIGKLLRSIDAEPIREALEKIENKHNQQQAMLHKLEILRDELVAKGDAALTDLLNEYPSADRQQLRNLIRAAQKEKEQNKPSKAYREIYQILKTLILED
ncbi:MAG: ribosome-associated protein [Haemophilus parainfluenzae]|uniref:ribosome biogenesis factor YjgA n=1 Tax=Haemophilus sp. TaxID=740 RepID=UPI0025D8DB27|nr:ribosome biogenesis factor YjgA [uncultured Haemophilus sp.]MBS4799033.1 ribosome-associated protein [Haemophilus parainfluenzae]